MSDSKKENPADDDSDVVVLSSDEEDQPANNSASTSESQRNRDEEGEDPELPEDFPPVEVCAERCKRFAEVTDTNEALAQFYLQDREWNLERSIQNYFEDLAERNGTQPPPAKRATLEPVGPSGDVVELSSEEDTEDSEEQSDDLMKVISWNIDGLDEKNLELRVTNVCSIIKRAQADVAMLQEVIPESLRMIKEKLGPEYHILDSGEGVADYFTAILLHKKRMKLGVCRVFPFANSSMDRKLQVIETSFKNSHKMFLFTSHLESTAGYAAVRKDQLRKSFRNIAKIPAEFSVLFSGDLNLRDKEVEEIGGLPIGMVDVWEEQGSRREAEFTWDMTRNDNLVWNARFKPKCRFDRMYFRKSLSQSTQLKPCYFGLIGIERLLPHRCFPSDHWGLYAHFKLT